MFFEVRVSARSAGLGVENEGDEEGAQGASGGRTVKYNKVYLFT